MGFPEESIWVSGETGLMSLEIDPGFGRNRRFYTCQGGYTGGQYGSFQGGEYPTQTGSAGVREKLGELVQELIDHRDLR